MERGGKGQSSENVLGALFAGIGCKSCCFNKAQICKQLLKNKDSWEARANGELPKKRLFKGTLL